MWRVKNAPKLSSKYLVHGIGAKLVSNWEQDMLYYESLKFICRTKMSMLPGLEVSYLACKCLFYRPQHNANRMGGGWGREGGGPMELNFEGVKMQK